MNDSSTAIIPADKVSRLVVMDIKDYIEKYDKEIEDQITYKQLTSKGP